MLRVVCCVLNVCFVVVASWLELGVGRFVLFVVCCVCCVLCGMRRVFVFRIALCVLLVEYGAFWFLSLALLCGACCVCRCMLCCMRCVLSVVCAVC